MPIPSAMLFALVLPVLPAGESPQKPPVRPDSPMPPPVRAAFVQPLEEEDE